MGHHNLTTYKSIIVEHSLTRACELDSIFRDESHMVLAPKYPQICTQSTGLESPTIRKKKPEEIHESPKPNVFKFIDAIKKKNCLGIKNSLTSNGILLSEQIQSNVGDTH